MEIAWRAGEMKAPVRVDKLVAKTRRPSSPATW